MKFWDSSAIVPLLVTEPASVNRGEQLAADTVMLVWWATPVECASALQRLVREGGLDAAGALAAIARLRELEKHWNEVEPTQQVRQQAERLLRLHPLRAADALQLAAAIIAADYDPTGLAFVTADERLAVAAAKEGFAVI
jgi:predicted nucleic acid-binding protein